MIIARPANACNYYTTQALASCFGDAPRMPVLINRIRMHVFRVVLVRSLRRIAHCYIQTFMFHHDELNRKQIVATFEEIFAPGITHEITL